MTRATDTSLVNLRAFDEALRASKLAALASIEGNREIILKLFETYEAAKQTKRGPELSLEQLLHLLRADIRRDIYECAGGGYAVSYGGGPVSIDVIQEALRQGFLIEKYPGKKLGAWRLAWPKE